MKKKLGRTRKKKEGTEKRISQKIAFWLTDSRFYLVIIIAVFIFHAYHFRFFIMDDAFTSFRYAQNLVDGHGIVYNPGERVEGYTNFLWTLIITCFMKAGFQPEGLSQVLGVISGVIGIVLTFLLSSKIAPKDKLLNLLACLFLSANTCYAVWSIAGMETTFFTAFILGGATRYIFELQNKERIPFSSVIFGIASLIRPEGLLFFGVTLIHQITLLLLKKGSPKNIFLSIGLFSSIFLPYYIWRYAYYGWPFPNTFYAKVGMGMDQYMRGFNYIKKFLFQFSGWIFLVIPLIARRINIFSSYLLLIVLFYLLYVIYVGGDALPAYRFLVPILPLLYLLSQEGIKSLYEIISKRKALVATLIIMSVGIPLTAKNSFFGPSYEEVKMQATLTNIWSMVGKWLKNNVSPDESVALSPAGAIPYYSKLYAIDMLGLCDLHIGHMKMKELGKGVFAGHEKGDGAYVLSRKPTYILLGNVILQPESTFDFGRIPWNNWALKSEREIWFDPKFHQIYQQVASYLGGGWYLHYFKLKENP